MEFRVRQIVSGPATTPRQSGAGAAHVRSAHFAAGLAAMAPEVTAVPKIISVEAPGTGWGPMAE